MSKNAQWLTLIVIAGIFGALLGPAFAHHLSLGTMTLLAVVVFGAIIAYCVWALSNNKGAAKADDMLQADARAMRVPEGKARIYVTRRGFVGSMQGMDVTLDDVRDEVLRVVPRGEAATTGQIPFTPRGKKTLELALREAVAMGHDHIGTEHVLLGLARVDDGVAAGILRERDVEPDRVRTEVVRWLSGSPGLAQPTEPESDDLELTSPPLAPEVIAQLERLGRDEQAALERQELAVAAAIRDAERRLRRAAARLVREWRRHSPT